MSYIGLGWRSSFAAATILISTPAILSQDTSEECRLCASKSIDSSPQKFLNEIAVCVSGELIESARNFVQDAKRLRAVAY